MNNLKETVWHENHVILGAIAGSGKFYLVPNLYKGDKYQLNHDILDDGAVYNELREQKFIPIEECTLLTRSIDSLMESEIQKAFICLNKSVYDLDNNRVDRGFCIKYIKARVSKSAGLFIYLLSIGIWTGSPKNTEVIK